MLATMRPFEISAETRERLTELAHLKPGFWESVTGGTNSDEARLISDIATADELGAVPSLANYLSAKAPTSSAAKSAIRRIMSGRTPDELGKLDEMCRQFSTYSSAVWPWAQIKPTAISGIAAADDVPILGLLSFHPSGWVRSEAVKRLDKLEGGDELVFLLIRANDWVDPVRKSAWEAVRRRLNSNYADSLANNMGLVVALEAKTRTSMDKLLGDIYDFLLSNPDGLHSAACSDDFRIRRAAYRTSYRLDEQQRAEFMNRALRDPDSLIRLHAARQAASLSDGRLRNEFQQIMLADHWQAVRSQALRMTVTDEDENTKSILLDLLLDRSRGVRSAARYYLSRMGIDDFRGMYRDAIDSQHLTTAIQGLGECGLAEDAAVIKTYLTSTNPKILAACLTATSRLLPNESDGLLIGNLAHQHKTPSNAAARQLKGRVTPETQMAIARLFEDAGQPLHVRLNALKLLGGTGKWDRLLYWLRGSTDASPKISEYCERGLRRWQHVFNRSFAEPSKTQVDEIRRLMAEPSFESRPIAPFLKSVVGSG